MGESFVSMPVNSVPRLNVVRQVLERMDELTVLRDLKMQMRTAADAARAGHADGLSLLDHRADAHRALGKVLVGGRVAAAVADDDVLPAHTVARRNDDRAGLGSIDGRAVVHAADVNAAVVGGGALDAGVALAEGRCDALAGRR